MNSSHTPSPDSSQTPINVACIVCAQSDCDVVCTAEEVEAQLRFLQKFHATRRRKPEADANADRTEFTQDYTTSIVACRHCGLLYRNPRPPASAVTTAYVEDRYGDDHLTADFLQQRRWAESKARAVAARIRVRRESVPVVIEVGSFVGGFLAAGQAKGWNILGIDPGKEVTAFCEKKGLPVFCGTLPEAPLAAASADAVVIWNTFDQLPAPDGTLAASRRLLHEQGLLVVRVPNGVCFRHAVRWRQKIGRPLKDWLAVALAWNNLLGFPYVYGYTLSTLDELMSRHGFGRIAVTPDTLISISNVGYTRRATWEEACVKWCCRAVSGIEYMGNGTGAGTAPWLDVFYRVMPTVPDTSITVSTTRMERRASRGDGA